MPITKSAKKALRQSLKRKARNLRQMKKLKAVLKKIRLLAAEKKTEDAKKLMPLIYKSLDKAAKTGLIKKNTASRKKSRITKSLTRALAKDDEPRSSLPSPLRGSVGEDEATASSPNLGNQQV